MNPYKPNDSIIKKDNVDSICPHTLAFGLAVGFILAYFIQELVETYILWKQMQ